MSLQEQAQSGAAQNKAFNNPIIERRADPWVYRHADGTYWFTATHPAFDRVILRRAPSIGELSSAGEVTLLSRERLAEWGCFPYVWAPELHFVNGNWYLFFTASIDEKNVWSIRQFVAKCTAQDPSSPEDWTLCGRTAPSVIDGFSVDSTFFECGGKWYCAWSQGTDGLVRVYADAPEKPVQNQNKACLYIAEADPASDFTHFLSDKVLIGEPGVLSPGVVPSCKEEILDWEYDKEWVNEAPAILKRDGKIIIVYSASSCNKTYCLGMLTASCGDYLASASAWTKNPRPVFVSSEQNKVYGPGHCSFSSDGVSDIIVYHARNYPELYEDLPSKKRTETGLKDPYRAMRAKRFYWTKDGLPDFGEAE